MKSSNFSRHMAIPLAALLAAALSGCGMFGGKEEPKTPTVGERLPVLSHIESGAEPDPELVKAAVVVPPQQSNTDWSQASATADKAYGHLALSATPGRVWTASIAGSSKRRRLAASPVIGGGKLFVMDTGGVVTAFDANSGARVWTHKFDASEGAENAIFGGGASFDGDRVFVTTGVGDVAALDAATGKELWSVNPAGPLRGAPTIAFNSVYVMTQDNQIFALNATDGATRWNESGSLGQASVFGVASPAAGQGTVIAGYSSGELVAYRYENGRVLWSDALARTSISTQVGILTDIDADPIIDRGRVYALGQGGRMAAYELVTGQRLWELNLAGISTPAIAGDWIFALTDDARLFNISRNTGKVRWVTQLPAYREPEKKEDQIFWYGPVLAGDRLWIANSEGQISTASIADGTVTPFTELDSGVSLPPVVANGTIYFLDDGGTITAFR